MLLYQISQIRDEIGVANDVTV